MTAFRDTYLAHRREEVLNILDVGSLDVNGSYRGLFENSSWRYSGADLNPGKNVDIVLQDSYQWSEIKSASMDVVISGQAIEHIEYFWLTILEVERILRKDGLYCLIAPSGGYEHRYPVDCWRFYPDGFTALARFAGLISLECRCPQEPGPYTDESNLWKDTVLVAKKPAGSIFRKLKRRVLHRLMRMMI